MVLTSEAPQLLWKAREEMGLSRMDLERLTKKNGFKVTEATIYNIEKGVSAAPYPRNIYALAKALNLDPAELFASETAAAR